MVWVCVQHAHVRGWVRTCAYLRVCFHVCVHIFTCVCECAHVRVFVCACARDARAHERARVRACLNA